MSKSSGTKLTIARWRYAAVVLVLCALPLLLVWQIAGLQVLQGKAQGYEFLQDQGNARTVREERIPANRGVITDRNGEPLAVSTPVTTVWANPRLLPTEASTLAPLASRLGVSLPQLQQRIGRYAGKEFMFLARQIAPEEAEQIMALKVAGVFTRREYKRFYPAGEVVAQLVGFTDVDDRGQEGIELSYDQHLAGVPGAKRVLKDLKGNVIKELGLVRREKSGENLTLSIDMRLQYLAYRELKEAVKQFNASSGSVVTLDTRTGEVLAMANQPSFNPNVRQGLNTNGLRNRAITDMLEPGSTMKPLAMVAALESGRYKPNTPVDTNPGYISLGRKLYQDPRNYGLLDITGILTKSSQVGMVKVAMDLDPDHVRDVYYRVGLGQGMGTGFPGETPGTLPEHRRWRQVERASYAFGYGLAVSPLQLAQAYLVLAADGVRKPVSLLQVKEAPVGEQVLEPGIAAQVRNMLTTVVQTRGGTGTRAAIPAYEVAGKTGTARKVGRNGYDENRHVALFAGMVPADKPKLVTVVVINDPRDDDRQGGGTGAAPVFSSIMGEALRLLRIPPHLSGDEKTVVLKDAVQRRGGVS